MQNVVLKVKQCLNTLQPNNKEDRKKFWLFRSEDIIEMFNFRVFIYIVMMIVHVIAFFDDSTNYYLLNSILIASSLRLILIVLVWFTIRRC